MSFRLSTYKRKFHLRLYIVWFILGIFWIILSLFNFILFWDILHSLLIYHFQLLIGISNLVLALVTKNLSNKAENCYQKHQNDWLCDYCGVTLEKIKLRSYFYGKTILCKNCHKNHHLLHFIPLVCIFTIFFLIFILTIPPFADNNFILLGLSLYAFFFSFGILYFTIRILTY